MPVVTLALALIIFGAGAIAGGLGALLGIGGGVFLVPFLNLGLNLPIKAAAAISLTTVIATSSAVSAGRAGKQLINLRFGMLLEVATVGGSLLGGVTAQVGAVIYYGRGLLIPPLAAAAVLGVQLGSWAGIRFGARAPASRLKLLMAIVLFVVSVLMVARTL